MLPLIMGLGGSALAGAGMLGMSPLLAGSLGSGLGSLLQGDDLGTAIGTGALSFLGGKMLGPTLAKAGIGSTPGVAPPNPGFVGPMPAMEAGLGSAIQSATSPAALAAAGSGLLANEVMKPPVFDIKQDEGSDIPEADAPNRRSLTPGINYRPGIDPEFAYFNEGGLVSMPVSLDVMAARKMQEIYSEPLGKKFIYVDDDTAQEEKERFERTLLGKIFGGGSGKDMMGRRLALQATREQFMEDYPEAAERLGMAQGGLASLAYQEGGEMDMAEEPNDKELISDAVDAIKGESPNPELVLGRFMARYGEEALRDLVERVKTGQFDADSDVTEGKVSGIGDGMDDMIPATLEGEQDVVLSDGEFIVPADVVSGLGNGSSDAGSKALYEMMDRVRKMRTGKTEQPEQVPQGMMLPA